MKKARKLVTLADLMPFLVRTGQTHLVQGIPEGAEIQPSCPKLAVSAISSGPIADLPPDACRKGKKRKEMNQTEHEFSLMLESRRQRGEILLWEYEAITFRWGVLDVMKYTPDFVIFDLIEVDEATPGVPFIKMHFEEVKGGFIRQVDLNRFKACRNRFTMFRFDLWQKTDGEWRQNL